jgi:hypothetical protein
MESGRWFPLNIASGIAGIVLISAHGHIFVNAKHG